MLRKFLVAVPITVLAIGGSTACATKKFVRQNVGEVNEKVDSMGRSLEETQERTRKNEGRITEVDAKAAAAGQSARAANDAAVAANSAAVAANKVGTEASTKIDDMVQKLIANPNGAYFEIEGHTDSVGGKEINEKIGMERAEAVKRYLFEQHQIPLHKMNVISYGSEKPVASNKTKEGRAQNRRVVIRVLA